MAKSLEQINKEYLESVTARRNNTGVTGEQRKDGAVTLISNVIFYGAILILLLTAATYTMSGGDNPLFGYRIFNVLTSSMEDVYPKGSMVLTQQVEGREIEAGDDITFYMSQNMTVTHRVIEVIEDYDGEGNRGFRTQGVSNPTPDSDITHEYNVIGRVIWSVPMVGFVIQYMTDNLFLTMGLFVLLMVLSFLIRMIVSEHRRDKAVHQNLEL